MSTHGHVDGRTRKVVHAINEQYDDDVVLFDVIVEVVAGTTPKIIIPASQVPSNKRLILHGFKVSSDGAAWSTGTALIIEDTAGNDMVSIAQANLPTATTFVSEGNGTKTFSVGYARGGADGAGLQAIQTGSFAGAAVVRIHVWGVIRSTTPDELAA